MSPNLKRVFGLSFPFIVDTMGTRMRNTYQGSGRHSGWVTDCDATTITQDTWGWATPTTQWCGLLLSRTDELDLFLKSYQLGAGKSRQIKWLFRTLSSESVSTGRIALRVLTEGGRATAWASTVDAGAGDPIFQPLRAENPFERNR